jgi:PAS domain S-box-containing protein
VGVKTERTAAGAVFVVLGVLLGTFAVWHLATTRVSGTVELAVGILPSFLLAAILLTVAVWVVRGGATGQYARRLVAWAVASGLFGAISASLFVFYEATSGATIYDAPLVIANTAAGFAVVGVVVGRYDQQARQRAAELTRYKELVENIPVGIFRTTPGPEGAFVETNSAMVDLFAAEDEAELRSTPISELYADPDDRAAFSEQLRSEGLVREQETKYERLDGEQFWASTTAIRHDDEDGQTYFDGILEDVTERKRYKQALERHNEQLEVLNDVLRHDVRNDMTVIRAHGELLREGLRTGTVDEAHADAIETLLSRVDHVVDLTRTARDLAEAVSAERADDLEAVPLADTLRDEIDAAREAADDAVVTVDGELPSVRVRADDMLGSVFRNLLTNAIQHNDAETPTVSVSAEVDGGHACVRVADNGPGIPDERKGSVFEHGQKGPDSAGTGLGLYLVGMLVDQYGGRVDVRDREPQGAAFTVELLLAADQHGSWFD